MDSGVRNYEKNKGKVYLFPTPIADGEPKDFLPERNAALLEECDCFVVEELRTARRFLRKAGFKRNFDTVEFFLLNEHTKEEELDAMLQPLREGKCVGVMSEAGLPCVADPGAGFVRLCQREGFEIEPLVGPSSIMLALMASGFNGQSFAFAGYLPQEKAARAKRIRELETMAYKYSQTQIFIEAPYRNNHLLESLLSVCRKETMLCIATEIGSSRARILSKPVSLWQKNGIDLNKRNTVFLLSK